MAIERCEVNTVFGIPEVYDLDTETGIKTPVDTGHATEADVQKEKEKSKTRLSREQILTWFIQYGTD